jgi:hypothetical protein
VRHYELPNWIHYSKKVASGEKVIRRQEAGGRRQKAGGGFWKKLVLPPKTFPLERGGLNPILLVKSDRQSKDTKVRLTSQQVNGSKRQFLARRFQQLESISTLEIKV